MRRSVFILIGVLALGAAVFAGAFFFSQKLCMSRMDNSTDDLAWLRQEFHLSDAEMAHVRELHEGYMPKCAEMCSRIAAKKAELETVLAGATNVDATAQEKLKELADLRAQCQAQMLQHFVDVSHAMPPEQGKRYLAEMQRMTLTAHEQMEENMSDHGGHEHHHE